MMTSLENFSFERRSQRATYFKLRRRAPVRALVLFTISSPTQPGNGLRPEKSGELISGRTRGADNRKNLLEAQAQGWQMR